jgi:uncharacterized protein (DUF342 family)
MASAITVSISGDGLKATVASIAPNSTLEAVMEAVKEMGVVHGIRSSGIVEAIDAAKTAGKPVTELVVAEGKPPKPKVPPKLEHCPGGQEAQLPQLRPISRLLSLEDPKAIRDAAKGVTALAVQPGTVLARKVVGEMVPGMTVLGQALEEASNEQLGPQFQPGQGVKFSESGTEYLAKHAGFAGILDGKVALLPPIWISPDLMKAAFLNVPLVPESVTLTSEDLAGMMSAAGVKAGADQKRVDALAAALANGSADKLLYLVAVGVPPEEPSDAVPKISFAHQSQAGTLNKKDGSIDLRERQRFPSVAKDEVVVECGPPVPGTPGTTLKGQEIDVRLPVHAELTAGDNVRLEKDGEIQKLVSEIDGGANLTQSESTSDEGKTIQYSVSVLEIAQVSGDVDYNTGNIDFKGNVEIKGRVITGFKVAATGDVVVGEGVEDGAEISAGGTLTVKQGIVGSSTKIEAGGGVNAKFVQDATIVAGGDVKADVYIRTANIRTEGGVAVAGKGTAGGIIGGETWAMGSIVAKNIGAEANATTLVSVGILPELFEEYKAKQVEAEKADDTKQAILKAIGISALQHDQIKAAILKKPAMKNQILKFVNKANELAKSEADCIGAVDQIGARLAESAKTARIDVTNDAHARVKIRIGNSEKTLTEGVKAVRFRVDRDGGNAISWVPLSEADKPDPEAGSDK